MTVDLITIAGNVNSYEYSLLVNLNLLMVKS